MNVMDLLDLCIDKGLLDVTIYDTERCEDIWSGAGDEVPGRIEDMSVESFDIPSDGHLTINVSELEGVD